jgi:hypothetical protein
MCVYAILFLFLALLIKTRNFFLNKVETRYKEFFNVMAKVQQAHGLPVNSLDSSASSGIASCSSLASASVSASGSAAAKAPEDEPVNQNKESLKQNELKQKMSKKRKNIIAEIIQTEKSYVQDLKDCLESYFRKFTGNVSAQPECLRGKEAIIFGNLEEIYSFHEKFVLEAFFGFSLTLYFMPPPHKNHIF